MKLWLLLLPPSAALAHMVSMSTGELKVEGNTARYELRMPAYEAAHARDPERTMLDHIRFRSGGVEGRATEKKCGNRDRTFACSAIYVFPAAIDRLDIECTFASATVPNHIHLLRAYRDGKSDQAIFDVSFTTAEVRFKPPAAWEILVRETGAGFFRAVAGVAPLLFLLSLAIAARSWKELIALAGAFVAGEAIACRGVPRLGLVLSPRFIEAAAALTIAYLAFEIILLPNSRRRWLVVGVLGLFHGAYFSLFLSTSGYRLPGFLTGVACAEMLVLGLFYPGVRQLLKSPRLSPAVPALAAVLMTTGVVWFVLRVWV